TTSRAASADSPCCALGVACCGLRGACCASGELVLRISGFVLRLGDRVLRFWELVLWTQAGYVGRRPEGGVAGEPARLLSTPQSPLLRLTHGRIHQLPVGRRELAEARDRPLGGATKLRNPR